MSSIPMDRVPTITVNSFDHCEPHTPLFSDDRVPRSGSAILAWADLQRALWAPLAVQRGENASTSDKPLLDLAKTSHRDLPKIDLQDLEKKQDHLEQSVKTALSLHVLSLEANQHVPHKFPHMPVLDAFHSPDCKLNHSFLPDGTAKTVQTAPDGSTRTQVRSPDGTKEAKVADRYGRPVLVENMNPDGTWTISEMTYPDSAGKMSPFVSSKRITQSDGTVVEVDFSWHGKVTRRHEYSV